MKRLFILFTITVLVLTSCNYIEQMSISKGRLLICDNGSYILISDGTPIVLSHSGDEMFNGLSTGDLIRVYHDGVEESYPARTGVDRVELIEEGNMADIDENVARQLCELGWLDYEDMCQKYMDAGYIINCEIPDTEVASYQYHYADMSINILDGWEYEIEEYTDGCQSFGINLRPVGEEGWIELHCHTSAFAVCGTGLENRTDTLAGYDVNIGTYLGDGAFSFITFNSAAGEYVVRNFSQAEWFEKYETDIMTMLDTVKLSPDQFNTDGIKEIAKQYVDKEYKDIWTYFDCVNGIWEVDFYNNSSDRKKIKLDTEGNLIG